MNFILTHSMRINAKFFVALLLAISAICFLNPIKLKGQVNTYTFAQAAGTYNALGGTPTTIHASGWDDAVSSVAIPFTFYFNCTSYTSCNVSSNGFITFGATPPATTLFTPISSATGYDGAISALGRDLISNSSTIVYGTEGTTPNQVFVIQWNNTYRYSGSARASNFNFQIRISETSNIIQLVYGACSTVYGTDLTTQVGLRGVSNADYNNRVVTNNWPISTAGAVNTATCNTGAGEVPSSGQTYTWTPICQVSQGCL